MIKENIGTEVLVGPPGRMVSNAGQQWYEGVTLCVVGPSLYRGRPVSLRVVSGGFFLLERMKYSCAVPAPSANIHGEALDVLCLSVTVPWF